jgi:hypothetical protein
MLSFACCYGKCLAAESYNRCLLFLTLDVYDDKKYINLDVMNVKLYHNLDVLNDKAIDSSR